MSSAAAKPNPRPSADSRPPQLVEPSEFFQVGEEEPGLRVYLQYDLWRALDQYAVRDTSRELAALLVGLVAEGPDGDTLLIEDAIEVGLGEAKERFSSRSWQHARRVARTRYPDRVILGWYHTHPGLGLDLSSEERDVHGAIFPEHWQILYVVDPVSRDRNFYRKIEGKLQPAQGFRIFGKESSVAAQAAQAERAPASPPPVKNEENLRERYLERTLEKIIRLQRRPAVRPIDVLILMLLVVNLAFLAFRPAPVAKVDGSAFKEGQQKMTTQLSAIANRMDKLEQHLKALQILDEQLSLSPSPTASAAPTSEPTAEVVAPSATPSPVSSATPAGEVKSYVVKSGDTLSLICEQFYKTSSPKAMHAVAAYNKIRGESIIVGQTLKIPAREDLKL